MPTAEFIRRPLLHRASLLLAVATVTAACSAPPAPSAGPSVTSQVTAPAAAALDLCANATKVSRVEAPTAGAPTAAPAAQPTPATAPPPAPTPRPAPTVDRIGFPEGYQERFKLLYVYDRTATKQVRVACGNEAAAAAKPGQPYPNGSVILFESWRPKEDASGAVVKDGNGRLIRETLTTIFVMKKEAGFGVDYKDLRNGDWEYVAYRPDKTTATAPANTAACAACHLAAPVEKDFVFRGNLQFTADHYGQTPPAGPEEVVIDSVAFAPAARSVRAGTTVTWKNSDVAPHTVSAVDKAFASQTIKPGEAFTFTFDRAGAFEYFCTLHPEQMRGARITVTS